MRFKVAMRSSCILMWAALMTMPMACSDPAEYADPAAEGGSAEPDAQSPQDEPGERPEGEGPVEDPSEPAPEPAPEDSEPLEEPEPTARMASGEDEPWQRQIGVEPLDTLEFDAGVSGEGLRYVWSVVTRPDGSTSTFTPNSTVASPSFFVDLAGFYEVEVEIFDGDRAATSTRKVEIMAIPSERLHVQLVWDTDRVDVDLHLLHPDGSWNASPYDCHWRNREPLWGDLSRPTDDPSLDIDDTDGFGPENINLNGSEDGLTYKVGAHIYADRGHEGGIEVTARIYIDGELRLEQRRLMFANQFWEVGEVLWSEEIDVTIVNQLHDDFP